MMAANRKVFTIQCVGRNKEVIKLLLKNMPELEELDNIEMIGRKLHLIESILLGSTGIFTFVFILSLIWFLASQTMTVYSLDACLYMIILLIFYAAHFIPVSIIERLIKKRIVIRNGCGYIWQYMSCYSDSRWGDLMFTIEAAHCIQELVRYRRADERHVVISFAGKFFTLEWTDYAINGDQIDRYAILYVKETIRNHTLEKDTMEFDFLKNELRVSENCEL